MGSTHTPRLRLEVVGDLLYDLIVVEVLIFTTNSTTQDPDLNRRS
jgi:hypothetical protein